MQGYLLVRGLRTFYVRTVILPPFFVAASSRICWEFVPRLSNTHKLGMQTPASFEIASIIEILVLLGRRAITVEERVRTSALLIGLTNLPSAKAASEKTQTNGDPSNASSSNQRSHTSHLECFVAWRYIKTKKSHIVAVIIFLFARSNNDVRLEKRFSLFPSISTQFGHQVTINCWYPRVICIVTKSFQVSSKSSQVSLLIVDKWLKQN